MQNQKHLTNLLRGCSSSSNMRKFQSSSSPSTKIAFGSLFLLYLAIFNCVLGVSGSLSSSSPDNGSSSGPTTEGDNLLIASTASHNGEATAVTTNKLKGKLVFAHVVS